MKGESLGLNHWLSFSAICQTVRPLSSALSSGHFRTAPPKLSSGMPRCLWYQLASAALSLLLLKKTPPIPVILAIVASILTNLLTASAAQRLSSGGRAPAFNLAGSLMIEKRPTAAHLQGIVGRRRR